MDTSRRAESSIVESRVKQSRAEQSRAEQSRAEQKIRIKVRIKNQRVMAESLRSTRGEGA